MNILNEIIIIKTISFLNITLDKINIYANSIIHYLRQNNIIEM